MAFHLFSFRFSTSSLSYIELLTLSACFVRCSGLTCLAIARADGAPVTKSIETGKQDRAENMVGFAQAALELFASVLEKDGVTKGSL